MPAPDLDGKAAHTNPEHDPHALAYELDCLRAELDRLRTELIHRALELDEVRQADDLLIAALERTADALAAVTRQRDKLREAANSAVALLALGKPNKARELLARTLLEVCP